MRRVCAPAPRRGRVAAGRKGSHSGRVSNNNNLLCVLLRTSTADEYATKLPNAMSFAVVTEWPVGVQHVTVGG